jgi:hypothetical protein
MSDLAPASIPGIPAAEAALRMLDPDTDPASIATGKPDSHRHAALLAARATRYAEAVVRRGDRVGGR